MKPSAEEQLVFLQNIQRILSEGNFVSTYKFALLHALADLSVIKGDDSGAPLELTTEELARQFLHLYAQQTKPFPGTTTQILRQNTGSQAAIINHISEAAMEYGGRYIRPEREPVLVNNIDSTIRKMPLWKLQRVGNEVLDFLYENTNEYLCKTITLKPGISFCFRTFYEFITSMVQQKWIFYIRKYNVDIIGDGIDLKDFLFGQKRTNLTPLREILYDLQKGKCFYTGRTLTGSSQVDHFIPWSRYPTDLGHNFVLACSEANRQKSDHIAYEEHLKKWVEFHHEQGANLISSFELINFQYNRKNSLQIAEWAYGNLSRSQAQVWVNGKTLCHLTSQWKSILNHAFQSMEADSN